MKFFFFFAVETKKKKIFRELMREREICKKMLCFFTIIHFQVRQPILNPINFGLSKDLGGLARSLFYYCFLEGTFLLLCANF